MKFYTQVACLTLIVAVFLVGCGGTAATPAVVDTVVIPPESPTSPPPNATQPLPSPTTQPPTETLAFPSLTPPPTDTTLPTTAPATPVTAPVSTQANLPVEGVWTGGGTDLLVDFEVHLNDGQANVANFGILWVGRGECELNVRLEVSVPIDESGFSMNYTGDDFSVVMNGALKTSSLITGVMNIQVEDCGNHQVNWQAVPKTSVSQ